MTALCIIISVAVGYIIGLACGVHWCERMSDKQIEAAIKKLLHKS